MQIQGVFKDFSRIKIKIFNELKTDIHSACVNSRKPKIPKTRHFLAYQEVSYTMFFKSSFGYFFTLFFCFVCCCEGRIQ